MSETARLGGKRLPSIVMFVTAVAAALVFFLGGAVFLFGARRPPSSQYVARLVAMQWVREPKKSGSLLAVCIRVTRRDGNPLTPRDFNVSVRGAGGQGLQPSTAVQKYLPNLATARAAEAIFFYRGIRNRPLITSLEGELNERVPPNAFQRLMRHFGHPMEAFFAEPVEGMPAPIPPTSPRASQTDLTAFIEARKGLAR